MLEEMSIRRIVGKVISLGISFILLLLFFVLKINKIQLIGPIYIIIALVLSFILVCFFSFFKYIKSKYLNYYYQVVDFMFLLNIALILVQIFFLVGFYKVSVSGISMLPTFEDKDELLVQSLGDVEHGSIIVAKVAMINEPVVKRVIAVAGDYFYYNEDHQLVLNGNIVIEPYLLDEDGNFFNNSRYNTITKPFDLKKVLECSSEDECVIPKDYYFVIGDHRRVTADSSDFGLIHISNILGVVKYQKKSFLSWEKVKWFNGFQDIWLKQEVKLKLI